MSDVTVSDRNPFPLIRWSGVIRCVALVLFSTVAFPLAAADGHGGRSFVSGDSAFSDCGALAIELSGDLNGCLDIVPLRFSCQEVDGFAVYNEWGEEFFADDDGMSSFRTKYSLEGIYAQGFCATFDFSMQLAGGCEHKIFGGRGRYLGANGSITFNDIIPVPGVSGASNFLYHGFLKAR